MATRKRISRRTVVKIEVAIMLLALVIVGIIIGKITTEPKVVTKTIVETVEVPTYEKDELPTKEEVTYFHVPLSHSLQSYIYEVCADEEVPVALVMAMIEHESAFDPEVISATNDYGLMQINEVNHEWLDEEYHCADLLNPYQNVFCGVKIISSFLDKYEGNYHNALMAYNMGDYGAKKARENGIKTSKYSERIVGLMSKYEEALNEQ